MVVEKVLFNIFRVGKKMSILIVCITFSGTILTSIPRACGTTRMSENMMAASSGNLGGWQ